LYAELHANGALTRDDHRAGRAYREIRAAILNLTFQPGQKLQETSLARWLGISRTPVREALQRLQSEGLIEAQSSRGVVVAQVSLEDVENAYRLLEVIEGLSSRLAAERLSEDGAAALSALTDQMRAAADAGDLDGWIKLDAELHDAVRAVAANPKLSQVASTVYPTIERVRSIYLREGAEPDRLAAVTADHWAMSEAIVARDGARAEALTRRLFAEARANNVRLLRHWVVPLRRSF
jgi:DNA-binding GntR family transcriptional regulator